MEIKKEVFNKFKQPKKSGGRIESDPYKRQPRFI